MIEIGRTILSRDIFEQQFLCDLLKCRGACCVEGDSGAPLTKEEAEKIAQEYPHFKKYISDKNKKEIEKQGFSVIDKDGDLVTPLRNNRECVYTFTDEKGTLKCAIEKAYFEGETDFRKPLSCHLFPIRITQYKNYDAINYQQLAICIPGKECGRAAKLPLYKFLKEPLIRKYGEAWYEEVEAVADFLKKKK
jgi:hypothetical protein